MEKTYMVTCIVCPKACRIEVKMKNNEIISVKNHQCKRGIKYAKAEVTDPRRVLTTTVKMDNGEMKVLPVRTKEAIPKILIEKAIYELKDVVVKPPVKVGDVILENILGTGIDVVATGSTQYI